MKSKKNVFALKNTMDRLLKYLLHFSPSVKQSLSDTFRNGTAASSIRNYSGCLHTVHAMEDAY